MHYIGNEISATGYITEELDLAPRKRSRWYLTIIEAVLLVAILIALFFLLAADNYLFIELLTV